MFELTTLVGNWGKVWIHSASLLFSLFYAAEELLLFCIRLCEINLFSSGNMKTSFVPLFLHVGPLCTDLSSFLRLSLQSSLTFYPIWDTDFWRNPLTCLSRKYFHLLHVEGSARLPGDEGCSCSRQWCVSALLSTQISLSGLQAGASWAIAGEWGDCCRCLLEESALAVILPHSRVHMHSPSQSSALKWRQKPWQSIFPATSTLCLDMTESENWAENTRFTKMWAGHETQNSHEPAF